VRRPAQLAILRGQVEAHLARVLGLELPCLELDHDIAERFHVEEEQVEVEIAAIHLKPHLRAHKAKPAPSSNSKARISASRPRSSSRSWTSSER